VKRTRSNNIPRGVRVGGVSLTLPNHKTNKGILFTLLFLELIFEMKRGILADSLRAQRAIGSMASPRSILSFRLKNSGISNMRFCLISLKGDSPLTSNDKSSSIRRHSSSFIMKSKVELALRQFGKIFFYLRSENL
jgi:hypothetical protein